MFRKVFHIVEKKIEKIESAKFFNKLIFEFF